MVDLCRDECRDSRRDSSECSRLSVFWFHRRNHERQFADRKRRIGKTDMGSTHTINSVSVRKAGGATTRREQSEMATRVSALTTNDHTSIDCSRAIVSSTPPAAPDAFADVDDLEWFADGAKEYAESATCPKCGGTIRPLRGCTQAAEATYECVACHHRQNYVEVLAPLLPEANLFTYKGVPRENPDGFFRCPECGDIGFSREEHLCYLCGAEDPCVDPDGHEIEPDDMEEYALTDQCPECNHVAELIARAE